VAILLPIVGLAVRNRVGVDRFVQAARRAYVQAAMEEAFAGSPKVNYSQLAVITGLTRKEVSALVRQIDGCRSKPSRASREQRALRVVRGWRMDPRFHDEKGRPAELPLRAGRRTFAALVKAYARDVTPMSVLTELERLNMVSKSRSKSSLRLLARRYSQSSGTQNMTELARLLSDFVNTVGEKQAGEAPPIFFSFRDAALSTRDQAARFERVFSNRAAALLEGFDHWMATQCSKETDAVLKGNSQARVGVGVYLVNEALRRQQTSVKKRAATTT
jgi:hypothetical protein